MLIHFKQINIFKEDILQIREGKMIDNNSKLQKLNPFL